MVKTKEDILKAIKDRIGEDTSDETIALLEDITDTLNDYDTKTKDNTDWKTKYEDNDKAWRQKYRDRFFNGDVKDEIEKETKKKEAEQDIEDDKDEVQEKTSFEDLFGVEGSE